MILVDTSPLVALVEPRDALHARALRDLDRLARRAMVVCDPVLTEACFLLHQDVQRRRLARLLAALPLGPLPPALGEDERRADAFRWLHRYAEHEPDWADAYLAVVASRERGVKVWTYDPEFRTTWRRLDGRPIPLAT